MSLSRKCKHVPHNFMLIVGSIMVLSNFVVAQTMIDIANDVTDLHHRQDSEPSIAINPKNPKEISVVTFSEQWGPGVNAPVWRSMDAGATWTKIFVLPQPPTRGKGPLDQHIGYDAQGNFFLAELDFLDDSSDREFNYIYRQEPVGSTTIKPGAYYGDDQPHIAIDRGPCSNRIYSPWRARNQPRSLSMVSITLNSGISLTDIAVGDNNTFANRTTRLAIAPNGSVFIVYKTQEDTVDSNFQKSHFRVLRSDNCGVTWDALGPSAVSVHGDAQVVTWNTSDFGNLNKSRKTNRAFSSDAWIAVSPVNSYVYVVYVNKDTSGFGQLYVARSTNRGVSWTSSRVTDGTHHTAFPEIAVAANGAIGVLYVDYDDAGSAIIYRHHFARSFDNGQHWSDKILQSMDPEQIPNAPYRKNYQGFIWGDYEGLTAFGNTFYGVFTGQSIGRQPLDLDPIFFTEPATIP